MAGDNGSGTEVIAIEELGQSGPLGQQVKAVEEEIGAMVTSSRQRLIMAASEELRRILRQNLTRLSAMAGTALQPQGQETQPAHVTVPGGNTPALAGVQADPSQGNSHQVPLIGVFTKAPEELETGASSKGHDSSRPMEALAKALTPQHDPNIQVGTRDGQDGHEARPSEIAIIRTIPSGGEAYSGTVQLAVMVGQSAIQALQFVDELCRHPGMRIQRLLGTAKGRLDIWVQLREPVHLLEELSSMEGVSQVNRIPVEGPSDGGAQLEVLLKEPQAAHVS